MIEAAKSDFSTVTLAGETPRRKQHVSAFVSRKEGKLFVRQGFLPLFNIPVTIRNPERPLGTHLFTAMEPNHDGSAMRWTVVSVPAPHGGKAEDGEPRAKKSQRRGRDEDIVRRQSPEPPQTAVDALDRIDLPKDAAARIADLMSPGFALIVSDQPISDETNDGTDFIVLTR